MKVTTGMSMRRSAQSFPYRPGPISREKPGIKSWPGKLKFSLPWADRPELSYLVSASLNKSHLVNADPLRRPVPQGLGGCRIVRGKPKQAKRLLSPNRVIEETWSSEIVSTKIPLAR